MNEYIDVYVNRNDAIASLKELESGVSFDWNEALIAAMNAIDELPTADTVFVTKDIVRCRDCTYCHSDRAGNIGCFHYRRYGTQAAEIKLDDYCSYGKLVEGRDAEAGWATKLVEKGYWIPAQDASKMRRSKCEAIFDTMPNAYYCPHCGSFMEREV